MWGAYYNDVWNRPGHTEGQWKVVSELCRAYPSLQRPALPALQ
jgi:hypothetical protein